MTDLLAHDGVLVLDGGLATELERRGHDLSDALWSARLLAERPEEIVAAHRTFYEAGAHVAITASYQASFAGFARAGIGSEQAAALMRRSVELAVRAREECGGVAADGRPLLVAASVGPYGATRADGSEYTGDYGISDAALRAFHRPRLEVLADAGADLLALETVPSRQEAEVLVQLLDELPGEPRAWLSLTCADERTTRRGDDAGEVLAVAARSDRVVAVGVNCTAPEHAVPLVALAAATGEPAVVYPNSGEGWDAVARAWVPAQRSGVGAGDARDWVAAGAGLVGGCCRVTPTDIAAIASAVRTENATRG